MDPRIALAVEILRTNPGSTFCLTQFARQAGLSESRFQHLFRQEAGETWKAYLKRLRLTRAQELLGDLDLSIKLIAFRAGYKNPANFSRAFKAAFGESPRTFRNRRHSPRKIAGPDMK
jgi:AraC family transcriptional regulator of arabinose operon